MYIGGVIAVYDLMSDMMHMTRKMRGKERKKDYYLGSCPLIVEILHVKTDMSKIDRLHRHIDVDIVLLVLTECGRGW